MPIYAGQIIRAADLNPGEWVPVSFENTWRNYGNGWSDCVFRWKPLTSTVEIRGTIAGSSEGGSNNVPADSLVFVLPEGYRPSSSLATPIAHISSPQSTAVALRVYTSGQVRVLGANALNTAAVTLDGVEFYVGQ